MLGSNPQASQIPLVYGVGHYGGDFGLAISVEQNVTKFDSHTDAVKTLLGGKAQIMATSFSAILNAREQGENVKMFCPYVSMDDFVLAGAKGVNTAGQLFEPLLTTPMKAADIVDRETLNRAVQLANQPAGQ